MAERRVEPDNWDEAVAETDGPQLIVAGPGSGKTEFLVQRGARIISADLRMAAETLIFSFSRRGAADLERRVAAAVQISTTGINASTFHSYARRLLEASSDRKDTVPTLLTSAEQSRFVHQLLAAENPANWPLPFREVLSSMTLAKEIADFLLRCQERLWTTVDVAAMCESRADWRPLPALYQNYLTALEKHGRLDYGSLQVEAVRRLEGGDVDPQCSYVLVDEYQDTAPVQVRLLELLSERHRNITVAADPYQSIYGFRGADLNNVEQFSERFTDRTGAPPARLVLTTSFRVPRQVLDAALRLTKGGYLPGGAGPVTPASHTGSVDVFIFDQQSAEAEWIAGELQRLHLVDGIPFENMAVLVRSKRRLLPELSRALHRRGIPHDSPTSRLIDHQAVRLVLDLVEAATGEAVADENESYGVSEQTDRAVRRLLLGPLLAVGIGRERDLLRRKRRSGQRWSQILGSEFGDDLGGFLADAGWAVELPAIDGFFQLWNGLGAFVNLVADPHRADFRAAWSSFAQVLTKQKERDPSVTLARVARSSEEDDFEPTPLLGYRPVADTVALTTLHQAKGLEFDVVVIADAVEGVFPDLRRNQSLLRLEMMGTDLDDAGRKRLRMQEEIRLAYTAMARARKRVVWTATKAGIDELEQRPSRFVLSVAGVESVNDLGPPPGREDQPIGAGEAAAYLRRIVRDPTKPLAGRLAAAQVLAEPPAPAIWDANTFAFTRERGPDHGLVRADMVLSPSQAESYKTCPRRYALERRLGVADAGSGYLQFGDLMHRVLENCEREALGAGARHSNLVAAKAELENVWAQADFGSLQLNQAWARRGLELLTALYSEIDKEDPEVKLVEHPLDLDLDGSAWTGRADRIDQPKGGPLRIVDYKTTSTTPVKKEVAESLQLGFYLIAAAADPVVQRLGDVGAAELWHPLANRLRTSFQTSNLEKVRETLIEIGKAIFAENWQPLVGRHCERCSVRLVCPAWPEGREAFT